MLSPAKDSILLDLTDPQAAAISLGASYRKTESSIEELSRAMMLSFYRKNPLTPEDKERNDKIKAWYKAQTGKPFKETLIHNAPLATFLFGPPGHGKTTAFKIAAQKCALTLGMNFLPREKLREGHPPGANDLVFMPYEMGGEVAKGDLIGLPQVREGKRTARIQNADGSESPQDETYVYSTRAPFWNIAALASAGASVFVLDDFTNTAEYIQNIGLPLTQMKAYQGAYLGEQCYVGMTGNLGSVDGTHTAGAVSSALKGRVDAYYTQDTMDDWISRINRAHPDDTETEVARICATFLRAQPAHFAKLPEEDPEGKPKAEGYPSPRTWDNLVGTIAKMADFTPAPWHEGAAAASRDFDLRAKEACLSHLGIATGALFAPLLAGFAAKYPARTLAKSLFAEPASDDTIALCKQMLSTGTSSDQAHFALTLSEGLADEAITQIAELSAQTLADHEPFLRSVGRLFSVMSFIDDEQAAEKGLTRYIEQVLRLPNMKKAGLSETNNENNFTFPEALMQNMSHAISKATSIEKPSEFATNSLESPIAEIFAHFIVGATGDHGGVPAKGSWKPDPAPASERKPSSNKTASASSHGALPDDYGAEAEDKAAAFAALADFQKKKEEKSDKGRLGSGKSSF